MSIFADFPEIIKGEKYLDKFRGEIFVIKCGGSLVENRRTGGVILDDIVLLKKNGIHPVLVHGGSVQADRMMETAGICPQRYRGLRITCEKTIVILEKCFGYLNGRLVNRLRYRGVKARGFSGRKGGLVIGERMRLDGVDLGLVGDMTGICEKAWKALPDDVVPVVASLGVGPDGETLNINADYVATKLALEIGASKLILMTDVDGVLKDPKDKSTLISSLTVSRAEELIADGSLQGGMIPKIESAMRAIRDGLPKIHMINGQKAHSLLLEIFTDKGVGTQITG